MSVQVAYQGIYLLFVLPLFISNILDNRKKDTASSFMNKIFVCVLLKIIFTMGAWALEGQVEYVFLNKIFSALKFGLGLPIIILFTKYVIELAKSESGKTKRIMIFMQIYCTTILLIDIFSVFFPLVFVFENGYYIKGPAYDTYHILYLGTVFFSETVIFKSKNGISKMQFWFVQLYLLAPIIGLLFEILTKITFDFINLSTTLALTIFYVTVHLDRSKQLVIREKELTDAKVALMISQIQPHFLYNALTAISMLCDTDAKKARIATDEFSDYLRGNLEALSQKKTISFHKELNHVKAYLHLEKIRFGDKLNVVYDIEEEDFFLPALSLQPVVENAVKHGLSKKADGGTITISTSEIAEYYQITVTDDGIGFNPDEKPNDNKLHIGIDNVKSRLQTMINADIQITSEKGKGTTVLISIPKYVESKP